jgi:hypothetical protein
MATIEQSIEVDVPLVSVQEGWERFAEWVLIGNYRLVCDALSCERLTDGETVSFTELGSRRSRVTVHFDLDDESSIDPADKLRRIATRLAQDLLYFREYLDKEFRRRGRGRAERKNVRGDRAGGLRLTPDSLIEHADDDTFGSPHYQA